LPDKRRVLNNVTYFDAIHGKMEADKSIVLPMERSSGLVSHRPSTRKRMTEY